MLGAEVPAKNGIKTKSSGLPFCALGKHQTDQAHCISTKN